MKIQAAREAENVPAFFLSPDENNTVKDIKSTLWTEIAKRTKTPKMMAISAMSGKVVIKPQDRETSDVLRNIMRAGNRFLSEDVPLLPRIIIQGVEASILPNEIPKGIADQNPHLNITNGAENDVIKPVFKRGPRDRDTVNWVVEVHPDYLKRFTSQNLYLGYSSCRVKLFEEVTQCLKCLKFGHPAKNCLEVKNNCAHCANPGHIHRECPLINEIPKCSNCKGLHSAFDKTCSFRSNAIATRIMRTAKPKHTDG